MILLRKDPAVSVGRYPEIESRRLTETIKQSVRDEDFIFESRNEITRLLPTRPASSRAHRAVSRYDELRRDLLPARNKFDSIGLNCKLYDFALGSDFGSAIRSRRNEQKVEFVAHSHRDYGIASNDGEMKFCIKKIQFGGEALSFDGFVDI